MMNMFSAIRDLYIEHPHNVRCYDEPCADNYLNWAVKQGLITADEGKSLMYFILHD
jgi:hypothetical protein